MRERKREKESKRKKVEEKITVRIRGREKKKNNQRQKETRATSGDEVWRRSCAENKWTIRAENEIKAVKERKQQQKTGKAHIYIN